MIPYIWKKFRPKISKGYPLWSANSFSVFRPKLGKFNRFPQTLLYKKIEQKIRNFYILHICEYLVLKNCSKFFSEKIIFSKISKKKVASNCAYFLFRLPKFSPYFSAFKLYFMQIGRTENFLRFFKFLTYFRGQKPSKKWNFFKPIQSLKLLLKSHSTPSKTPRNVILPNRKYQNTPD